MVTQKTVRTLDLVILYVQEVVPSLYIVTYYVKWVTISWTHSIDRGQKFKIIFKMTCFLLTCATCSKLPSHIRTMVYETEIIFSEIPNIIAFVIPTYKVFNKQSFSKILS